MATVKQDTRRALPYLRVSRDRDGDKMSPDVQRSRIQKEIENRGWAAGPEYKDIDVSGSTFARAGWTGALEEAKPGDVIVATDLSRVGRNLREYLELEDRLDEMGVELLCLDNPFDSSTAMGWAACTISMIFSETMLREFKRKVRDAKEKSREVGRWQGGKPVLGYRRTDACARGQLKLIKKEAAIVRKIYEMRAENRSFSDISRWLQQKGVKGPLGGFINPASVQRICKNPIYHGHASWGGSTYRLDARLVPPIIPEELWEQVQAVNMFRGSTTEGARDHGTYMLSGIMVCGKCESRLVRSVVCGKKTPRNQTGTRFWICGLAHNPRNKEEGQTTRCSGVKINENIIEGFVEKELFQYLNLAKLQAEIHELEKPTGEMPDDEMKEMVLKNEIQDLRQMQNRLLDAYARGDIGEEELARVNQTYRENISEDQIQLTRLRADRVRRESTELKLSELESLDDDWNLLNGKEKNAFLHLFCESIVVQPGRGIQRISINWRESS